MTANSHTHRFAGGQECSCGYRLPDPTRNEAAERLRGFLNTRFVPSHPENHADWLDEALAAERNAAYAEGMADGRLVEQENTRQAARATVERIRERIVADGGFHYEFGGVNVYGADTVQAILDEEAAR